MRTENGRDVQVILCAGSLWRGTVGEGLHIAAGPAVAIGDA